MKSRRLFLTVSLTAVALLAAVAAENNKSAYDAAREKLAARDYAGVRAECDRGLAAADLEPNTRFNLLNLKAASYEREHEWAAARDEYRKIMEDPDVDKGWKLRAAFAAVRNLEREKKYTVARELLDSLFEVTGISGSDRVKIHEALARVRVAGGIERRP